MPARSLCTAGGNLFVAGERFDVLMRALANESSYAELADAPVVALGHSACTSFPWNFAAWNPSRTLAIFSIKEDAPQTNLTGSGIPNPDWGNRNLDGIPGLMAMSEYERWEARLPAENENVCTVKLIDPSCGRLVNRWRGDIPPKSAAASTSSYTGDRSEAFWCFAKDKPPLTVTVVPTPAEPGAHAPDLVGIARIVGPAEPLTADMFRIAFGRTFSTTDTRNHDIWLLAHHPGNVQFEDAVQQGQLKLTPNIAGAKLRFTPIPPRARLPLKITVVAWQRGHAKPAQLQTATPVEQTFELIP